MEPTASSQKRVAVFTICSNNYLPLAQVMLSSVGRHHPDAALFICLADRRLDMPGLYTGGWTVVEAEALPIADFASLAFRYDIMEFNTALKPFMFQHLLEERGYDIALYFDPDIEIYRPLDAILDRLAAGASFYLTPHLCTPSESPVEPNDLTIMRAGIYNLGFLGVARGAESSRIIAWWARHLRYECLNAQHEGLFVDQKFMDLVPAFAPHAVISHDTTQNVAYWNLPQRRLERTAAGWTVDGAALTFFHYSGFDPRQPGRLSKHEARFAAGMAPPMAELTAAYAARLLAAGHGTIPGATYAFGRFASGTVIHDLVRRMFREWHRYWPQDPFATYEAFLHEPWPGGSRAELNFVVTNFMKFLHGHFQPLRDHYTQLHEIDHVRGLVHWFVNRAANELELDLKLIEPSADRIGSMHRLRRTLPDDADPAAMDVTLVGYLRTASGIGEAARQTLLTLDEGGLRAEGLDVALGVVSARDDASCEAYLTETGQAPVQIFHVNADQLLGVVEHTRAALPEDALRISVPFWELSRFPDILLPSFDLVNEVWAPSRFIQSALAGRIGRPVLHMPLAIEIEAPPPLPRARFGLPEDRFLFFFSFDALSFMERKNPVAAVRAFRRAFPRYGQAGLVLKCMNSTVAPEQVAALLDEIGGNPDIILLDATLSRSDTLGLLAIMDAVLSLHRSEGLGLLIAEAMLLGKPVIATGYSASRELVTDQTGYNVAFHLVPVPEGEYPFAAGQCWANPDLGHAAWLMRRLQQDPHRAAPLVAQAREHLHRTHGRRHVAALQRRRLQQLGLQLA